MEELKIVRLDDPAGDPGERSFGVINGEQNVVARLTLRFDGGTAYVTYLYVDERLIFLWMRIARDCLNL